MLGTASKKGNSYDIQNNLVWRQLSLMHKRHSFVFTEDIDEFEHNYFSDENVESNQLEAQKQRYFRSKAGKIVTDY